MNGKNLNQNTQKKLSFSSPDPESSESKKCPICHGIYQGDDIYHHTCSKCWNCPKSFIKGAKNYAERYNKYDRFKPYYNTCVNCAYKQLDPPPIIVENKIYKQSKLLLE